MPHLTCSTARHGAADTPVMRTMTPFARSTSTGWKTFIVSAGVLALPALGISQDKLPLYVSFFRFVHNACRRGKALLGALIAGLGS